MIQVTFKITVPAPLWTRTEMKGVFLVELHHTSFDEKRKRIFGQLLDICKLFICDQVELIKLNQILPEPKLYKSTVTN